MNSENFIFDLQLANILMSVGCIIYLAWWSIAFNPTKQFPFAPKLILFLLIASAFVTGIVFLAKGMIKPPVTRTSVQNIVIFALGVLLYLILLFVTRFLFKRQITTELALIVGWTIAELCVTNTFYQTGVFSALTASIFASIIFISMILSMICYVFYYHLEKVKAFYVGMIPLALSAIVMILEVIAVATRKALLVN